MNGRWAAEREREERERPDVEWIERTPSGTYQLVGVKLRTGARTERYLTERDASLIASSGVERRY